MKIKVSILCLCVIFFLSLSLNREKQKDMSILEPINEQTDTVELFNKAVSLIKRYEQWHSSKHYPYVAYGHRLLPDDNFSLPISKTQGSKLLVKDLKKNMNYFEGSYSERLLLGMLAYNVGQSRVLNSTAYKMIKKGHYSIAKLKEQYVSWCIYNGRKHKGIRQRRIDEFKLIYNYE